MSVALRYQPAWFPTYQPPLPAHRVLEHPQGKVFLRQAGDPSNPTVVLIHGLTASSDLNWSSSFDVLSRSFHVLAMDMRGHGHGLRVPEFHLEDCADDIAFMLDALNVRDAVLVGYSMGGLVAQIFASKYPSRTTSLVLCATSDTFNDSWQERVVYAMNPLISWVARFLPVSPLVAIQFLPVLMRRAGLWEVRELQRSSPVALSQAFAELGHFEPRVYKNPPRTAVVLTARDQLVPPKRQRALASALNAEVFELDGDHFALNRHPDEFNEVLVEAIESVRNRPAAERRAGGEVPESSPDWLQDADKRAR